MRESFEIKITNDFSLDKLKQGFYIFMFRATRIPPHLGIITNGKLYDISLQGPNVGLAVEDFIDTVNKRQSEVIFIELKKPMFNSFLDDEITHLVNKHRKVTKDVSCLFPIREFLAGVYFNPDLEKNNFIFELLPILEQLSLIESIVQLNLDNKLKNNKLELLKYSKKDVENCIAALNRKEEITC